MQRVLSTCIHVAVVAKQDEDIDDVFKRLEKSLEGTIIPRSLDVEVAKFEWEDLGEDVEICVCDSGHRNFTVARTRECPIDLFSRFGIDCNSGTPVIDGKIIDAGGINKTLSELGVTPGEKHVLFVAQKFCNR